MSAYLSFFEAFHPTSDDAGDGSDATKEMDVRDGSGGVSGMMTRSYRQSADEVGGMMVIKLGFLTLLENR